MFIGSTGGAFYMWAQPEKHRCNLQIKANLKHRNQNVSKYLFAIYAEGQSKT